MIWTSAFWKGAGERALKTFLQVFVPAFVLAIGATVEGSLDAWTAPWLVALQTASGLAVGATVLSFLTSLMSADFVSGSGGGELPYKSVTTLADGTVIETQYGTPEAADMGDSFRDVVAEGHKRAREDSAGQAHGDYDYPPGESPMGR